jgi:hypothetical protein
MISEGLIEYRKAQKRKYEEQKTKKQNEIQKKLLLDIGYEDKIIDIIIENKYVDIIQKFFRKFRFNDKLISNLQNIIDYKEEDIIKFRHGFKVYGFHYLDMISHFENYGYFNPINEISLDLYHIRRINSKIKKLNKYIFTTHSQYEDFQATSFNLSDSWNSGEIYNLLESRGINTVKVSEEIFNSMLELPPSIYAVEIICKDNPRRSYAMLDSFPSQDIVNLPIGIYQQLKVYPKDVSDFKMRIIEPMKGTKIGIRCMITRDNLLSDIKGKLTSEINKHKILSLNQIIIVESDVNYGMIPFRVEVLEPSNVIDITDIDINVDFLESLPYEDVMEALIIELNK